MTPDKVAERVKAIDDISGDAEAAHAEEDGLWFDVLKAIADGAQDAQELAKEALKTTQLKFPRWCA